MDARRGGTPTWQIRTVDDMQFFAPDLKTLRAWITEGRLHPDDQVSRTGKHWLRLGDMPEFSSSFAGFRGLPEVFVPVESPALDELGPPPSYGGEGDDTMGVPELMSPPSPTGAIQLESAGDAMVRKRVASRELPSTLATEPVLEGRRPQRPPPPPAPSRIPTAQAAVSGETRSDDPLPSIDRLGPAEPSRAMPSVPAPVPDHDSGIVVAATRAAVEASGRARAASMLHAVTSSIVAPVTRPASAPLPVAAPERGAASTAPEPERLEPDRTTQASAAGVRRRDFDDEREPGRAPSVGRSSAPRRRGSWPLVAGLGALAGIALVFGIPSVRNRVLGVAGGIVGEPSGNAARDRIASGALTSLDDEALREAEATLRDGGDTATAAEIVATRALLVAIEARIAGRRAGPLSPELDTAVADAAGDPRASVLVALARGELPDTTSADRETQLLAAAAPLWRDPKAGVPAGVISGLEAVRDRSGLGAIVLALAYWRGGDERRAGEIVSAMLERAPGQATATALKAAIAPATSDPAEATGDAAPAAADASAEGDTGEVIAMADDGDGTGAQTTDTSEPASEDGPRLSVDGLISRGCSKVEGGDASGGVKLLAKAHDRRPADVDAMVCLGQGYAKLGSHGTALKYFEGTLERSPKFVAALRGAAKSAARLGKTTKAVGYYERLLAIDSGNADAKAYVAQHGGGGADGGGDGGTPRETGTTTEPAPGEPPSSPPAPAPDPAPPASAEDPEQP